MTFRQKFIALAIGALAPIAGGGAEQEKPAVDELPDLGRPEARTGAITAGPRGASFSNTFDGRRLVLSPEYSEQTGLSLGGVFAFPISDSAAGGLLVTLGGKKQEFLFNAGLQVDPVQRIVLTAGQLRQDLEFAFLSGKDRAAMIQNSGAFSYQRFLGRGLVNAVEFNGYLADTPSRDLADKTYAIETATLFELWNDPRRVAGGRITGLQGRLAFTPWSNATLRLGLGSERLEYDYLAGKRITTRGTTSADWNQRVAAGLNLKAGLDGGAAQNRFTLGLERVLGDGSRFGIAASAIRGRDGAPDDKQLKLSWTYHLGGRSGGAATRPSASRAAEYDTAPGSADPAWGSLLDQVAKRPAFLPTQVVAKLDTTAASTRLVAIDKAALPAGASIDAATGAITVPLGTAVAAIASVTRNGAPFVNDGQFGVAGSGIVIDTGKIAQPAAGSTDTYVVTTNNVDLSNSLITISVSHGSVKIDSIVVTHVTNAPTASGLSITGTAQVGQTLTGHYTYADPNNDPEGTSTFRWLRNGVAIAGATAITYTLVAADQGNAITFEVTPKATVAPTTGLPVVSAPTAQVAGSGVPAAPTASGVSITGTAQVGLTLTGHYTYADPNNDPEGTSTFRWLRDGVVIAGATASTYTLVDADASRGMTFEVTPVSTVAPTTGSAVVSASTASVVGGTGAPTASNVYITGTVQAGEELTGHYTYFDPEGNAESGTTFRWLRNGVAIAGATSLTYTLVPIDAGKTITFEVKPITVFGVPNFGIPVVSSPTALVAGLGAAQAPTANNVGIGGSAIVGQTLTGSYVYYDYNGEPEAVSTFRWLRDGVAIPGATATTYTLVAADEGHAITFEVTAVTTLPPTQGAPVVSNPTAAVSAIWPTAPTASAVTISGTAALGQTLTGHYTYADVNSDPEGVSTFRWLRNGVAIAGATSSTYTLVIYDAGSTIAFEVTPISTVAPTTGTAVASAATASVTGSGTPTAPEAHNVSLTGTAQVGETLTGSYLYADINGDPQGATVIRWLRDGVAIAGATAGTYTLVGADQGKPIVFEVTPVTTVAPTTGVTVASTATAAVLGVGAPAAPTATNVTITGTVQSGNTLTGNYTFVDPNNDPEGVSTFRWKRNGITVGTATTYALTAADLGATFTFTVVPVATVAPVQLLAYTSAATSPVAGLGAPATPTASSVSITGTAQVGYTLTGHYTYADANAEPEATSTFRWLRDGVAIPGATGLTYGLTVADAGRAITFEITPVSTVAPTAGTPVTSSATAAVANPAAAPVATNLAITGDDSRVGNTLTGAYTYADYNGDAQGSSTFRWLRDGVVIPGETNSTYVLVDADFNTYLTFEVTPRTTVAPTDGTPVTVSRFVDPVPAGYVAWNGYYWTPPFGTTTWINANNSCSNANYLGLSLGWRLPTRDELQQFYQAGGPTVNTGGNSWTLGKTWTSTSLGADLLLVHLGTGVIYQDVETNLNYGLCVFPTL